jgi:hypothetical protein
MKVVSLILFSFSAYGAAVLTGGATSNGIWVNYETHVEPPIPPVHNLSGGSTVGEGNTIKKFLCNFENRTYSGYDLIVELIVDPLGQNRYRMRFAPLTITPEKMNEMYKRSRAGDSVAREWSRLPLPSTPVTMEIRAGETVALDLFVNPSTGQKITDYLTIKGGGTRQEVKVEGAARDFRADDAEFEISAPHVSIDGKFVTSTQAGMLGQAIWIDLPGHGRFVFSLMPRPDLGMQKAGEIRGTTMLWRSQGHEYTITTDKPIATGSAAYNLYVLHIPRTVEYFGMSAGPKPDAPIRRKQ